MKIWYDGFNPNLLAYRPIQLFKDKKWIKTNASFSSEIEDLTSCHGLFNEVKKIERKGQIFESCDYFNLYIEFYSVEKDTAWFGIGDNIDLVNVNGKCYENSLELMSNLYSATTLELLKKNAKNKNRIN